MPIPNSKYPGPPDFQLKKHIASDHPHSKRRHFNIANWVQDIHNCQSFLSRNRWEAILTIGLALRLFSYFHARPFWLDESMLFGNLVNKSPLALSGPLIQEQVVPPGYLAMLRFLANNFSASEFSLRFPSLVCGCLAFLLFLRFCYYSLPPATGSLAASCFALNPDLIYYCSEMKPYAIDLLACVALFNLMNSNPSVFLSCPLRSRQFLGLTLFLVIIPWFSIASLFPMLAFFLTCLIPFRNQYSVQLKIVASGLLFLISFIIVWWLESTQIAPHSTLWKFWDFAFLKPLKPIDSIALVFDNLINPLHLLSTVNLTWLMFPWAILIFLMLIHGLFLQFQDNKHLASFVFLTLLSSITASLARKYPFHGRTILFLCPLMIIPFALSFQNLKARCIKRSRLSFLLNLLVLVPLLSFLWVQPWSHLRLISFDGDLQADFFTHLFGLMSRP